MAAVALAVVALGAALRPSGADPQTQQVLVCAAVVALLGTVLLAGSAWVDWQARHLARSGRPVDLLAAGGLRRLAAPAGRAAGAVAAAGLALGVTAALAGDIARLGRLFDTLSATGLLLAAAATGIAVLVAAAAMTLAAADDLATNARSMASVAALGAEPALLERVQLRRLSAVIVVPLTAGILLGGALYASPGGLTVHGLLPNVPVLLTAATAALLGRVLCALLMRALRGRLRAATAPANLRIA